jgi:tetratricopeptide (TPR) repeat protein
MNNLKLAAFCVQHVAFLKKEKPMPKPDAKEEHSSDQLVTRKSDVYTFFNDFEQAIDILNKQLESKPDVKIYNLLGKVFMKAKDWNAACAIFEKSLQLIVSCLIFFVISKSLFFKFSQF